MELKINNLKLVCDAGFLTYALQVMQNKAVFLGSFLFVWVFFVFSVDILQTGYAGTKILFYLRLRFEPSYALTQCCAGVCMP